MIRNERRFSLRLAVVIVLVLLLRVAPRWTLGLERDEEQLYEVLVKLQSALGESGTHRFFALRDLVVVKRIPRIDVWVVASPEMPTATLARRLEQSDDVLWVEPNGWIYASGVITPNDNFYLAQQWNLRQIGLPEAWVFTTGNANPIAVIDTGIDLDHPDLAAKIWTNTDEIPDNGEDDDGNGYVDDVYGWNFVTSSTLPIEQSHGTHVAGIVGAQTNNSIGVAGVNWQSSIMPLQALQNNVGSFGDLAEAIIYAADNGARVINLSLGGDESSQTVDSAIAYARGQDCLLVAAAGNDSTQPQPVLYPAASPEVLAVAAATASDAPWSYSNRGPEMDVAAPGVDIYSTSSYGQYAQMDGTSMATSHVSGLAALLWAQQPALTADQVAHVITSTAQDVYTPGWDQRTGWGRIDALAAILELKPHRAYLPLIERQFFRFSNEQ